MKKKTIQHLNPVLKSQADYIIGIHLSKMFEDYEMVWEQLWSKQIASNRFMICCIPFFAYDLSLGDEVITDSNQMIQEVVRSSGQITYRVWFENAAGSNTRKSIIYGLEQRNCFMEWYSNSLLGVSCLKKDAQTVADFLLEMEKSSEIRYETGKTA